MTYATVGKWGNNLAVRLPGEIVIRRAEPQLGLAKMFQGKSAAEWRAQYAGAYDWGPDIGREAIDE